MNLTPFVPSTGVERQFAWLSRIPHGSGNERALSDAIRRLAQDAGLETWQDAMGNLLVRKDAAPGRERCAPVLLQAHMDMVCTKIPGCAHDFLKDPISLVANESGWLRADGTSLGADDGYGVAYMLELLLSDGVKHPPLECLFTVQEEIGLLGAAAFDMTQARARRMISMDCGGETSTTVSTCGGRRVTFALPLRLAKGTGVMLALRIGGLTGGHSAGEIHRGRANAIRLLGHVLCAMEPAGATLAEMSGGEAANAIPRDARALIRVPESAVPAAAAIFAEQQDRFMKQYHATDPGLTMTLLPVEDNGAPGWETGCARLLTALHDGVRLMDPARSDVVALSDNIGVLSTSEGVMRVQCMIRSANRELCALLSGELTETGRAFGAAVHTDSDYPGMVYRTESAMREQLAEIVREEFGQPLTERSTHGGMEVGYLAEHLCDVVTLGPELEGCHSPSERMHLGSFNRVYSVLTRLLERLP